MDFKSLLNKLDSMEAPAATPNAPTLPATVQLNEAASLRVLSGRSTVIAEAAKMKKDEEDAKAKVKSKKEEKVDEAADMKDGEKKKSSTGGTIEKTKTGLKHTSGKNYSGKAAEKEDKSKKTDESTEYAAFKSKFMQMVEAKKAEDAEEKKAKKAKKEKMEEGSKPDFLDMDKDGDKKEPMKKAVADKKKGSAPKKGENPFAKKTDESKMMPKGKKRPMKESVERSMSFREMMKLVVESGGQQQIDPIDKELFAWASRVARTKLGEGMKAEVYAGMTYERMGGRFEMYDVLSETKQ